MISQRHLQTQKNIKKDLKTAISMHPHLPWNEFIPIWNYFIPSWNEFIPSHGLFFTLFSKNSSRQALNNILWKILYGANSIKIFWFLATTLGSQFSKKMFNPSMNSFQCGMNSFQIRMNSFQMVMYSFSDRYSHTDKIQNKTIDKCITQNGVMRLYYSTTLQ